MRLGMHVLSKASNQLYGNDGPEREQHVAVWRQMGVTDLKLVTDGDSQLKSAKWLVQQGFRVMVRFYRPPIALDAVPDDQLKLFRDVGVTVFEGYTNEPEIEWGRPPTPEIINDLAMAHIRFADACGRCFVVPLTPAIQGDRVYSWFEPFIAQIIALGRADVLHGSFIACHPRPSNNLPATPPPGFVARSYETFDDVMVKHLGTSRPIYATEFGYEPGDAANDTLPKIDYQNHATYNVRLAQMDYRPCLYAAYYWTWLNDWFDSGWWRGSVNESLPVVKAFIDMAHQPELPVVPPVVPPPPLVNVDAALRKAVAEDMATYPWGIKYAYAHNLIPWGDEVGEAVNGVTWFAQPAYSVSEAKRVLIKFQQGHYTDAETTVIPWEGA